jgi:hypothetical protein
MEWNDVQKIKDYPPVDMPNGLKVNPYYQNSHARQVAHLLKEDDPDAINEASLFLASEIHSDCVLIPAPQSTGKARYTLSMCKRIKEIVGNKFNITIANILESPPRESLYSQKMKQMSKEGGIQEWHGLFTGIYIAANLEKTDKDVYLVDNHLHLGTTMNDVKKLIPNIKPLIWSCSIDSLDIYKNFCE